ncbi:kinase [Bacillus sp. DX4.1]|uniref:kinase n=1 Tax=Bacillus sp. DX4.1 TaxID=3055867 RepID=UPI0025A0E7D9|nr:kinase [Bacillus sp. DX4.1]MDM5188062.1 kinase [Bacillus sp. DX4.1]
MTQEDNLLRLLEIISKVKTGTRFILGIDGLSRSGKTTLVKKLSGKLQEELIHVSIFHIDDHIVERKKRYNTGNEEWFEHYYLQWDVKWLQGNLFKILKTSKGIRLPFYENKTDTHEIKNIALPETGVIIIEGVFLQRREWKDSFDCLVYLDCPRDQRFSRESKYTQENLAKFKQRYWMAEEHYLKTEFPKERANLVLKV